MRLSVVRSYVPIVTAIIVAGSLAAANPQAPAGASAKAAPSATGKVVFHDSFRQGVSRWDHPPRTRVSIARVGHRDARAMSVSGTPKASQVRVKTRVRKAAQPGGRVYRAVAMVKAPRIARAVGLRVREVHNGQVVGRSVKRVRLKAGTWTSVTARYRKQRANSKLNVQVFSPSTGKRTRLLIDDVRLRVLAQKPAARGRECSISKRGIPSCDAFFGASVGLNGNPTSLERSPGGRGLGLHRTFYQASQVTKAVTAARDDLRAGRLPWISFKLPHSWQEMARGKGDAWARNIAQRLSNLPGPVWVAFHHEPENDNEPIAQWTRLQQRLAPIVRQAAPNVAYTVILMGWHQFYGDSPSYRMNQIMPTTKIDVVGFDLYNRYGTPGSNRSSNIDLRAEYFQKIAAWTNSRDVEWAIGETGYTDKAFAADRNWLLKSFRDLKATGGIGMSYFNSAPANATGDWLLDTPARVSAFTRVQQESLYLP